MIRLDREMTGELLLRHPEKFSVSSVVAQLGGMRDLQHWYLGLLFDRSPEMYGSQEYAPFHALQVRAWVLFQYIYENGGSLLIPFNPLPHACFGRGTPRPLVTSSTARMQVERLLYATAVVVPTHYGSSHG